LLTRMLGRNGMNRDRFKKKSFVCQGGKARNRGARRTRAVPGGGKNNLIEIKKGKRGNRDR